jgi:predicted transcriptional regulator
MGPGLESTVWRVEETLFAASDPIRAGKPLFADLLGSVAIIRRTGTFIRIGSQKKDDIDHPFAAKAGDVVAG